MYNASHAAKSSSTVVYNGNVLRAVMALMAENSLRAAYQDAYTNLISSGPHIDQPTASDIICADDDFGF
jgi:hypothetical protein